MNLTESHAMLDEAIEVFLIVLRSCWQPMTTMAGHMVGRDANDVLADWAQANWEMIVEAAMSVNQQVFIEPYADGADCNVQCSRVWAAGTVSTHAVHCVPRTEGGVLDVLSGQRVHLDDAGLPLDRFASRTENGWYLECPPFDHVLLFDGDRELLISLRDVQFVLRKVTS